MALFEYFPNYIWNLSVAMALESGGKIGEIVDMCQPIRDAAANGADAGTPQFMKQWVAMADRLVGLADEDEAKGRAFSASDKLERAALYLLVAERMQAQGSAGREATYSRALQTFTRSTALGRINRERVEIPLGVKRADGADATMPALYTRAPGTDRRPVVVYCNGLDSCKELLYWSGLPEALARRGVSTLSVDQPGSGEALRLQKLPVDPHSESWASRAVDWLQARDDVNAGRARGAWAPAGELDRGVVELPRLVHGVSNPRLLLLEAGLLPAHGDVAGRRPQRRRRDVERLVKAVLQIRADPNRLLLRALFRAAREEDRSSGGDGEELLHAKSVQQASCRRRFASLRGTLQSCATFKHRDSTLAAASAAFVENESPQPWSERAQR